jgi:hypothetical protein
LGKAHQNHDTHIGARNLGHRTWVSRRQTVVLGLR